jgi:preprotein translocase subunit SecE
MSPKRIVVISYVVSAVLAGYLLTRLVSRFVFEAFRFNNPHFFDLDELSVGSLIGYGVAIVGTVIAYRTPKLHELSLDVAAELRKVTWPGREEIRTSTVAVILASAVCALLLGVVYDFLGSKIMTEWIPSALNWIAARS